MLELQIAMAIALVVLGGMMGLMLYSARSFAALTNYVDLDNRSRNALDVMTREIRQANRLLSGSAHSMTFLFRNPTNSTLAWTVLYKYDPNIRTLTRTQGDDVQVLLEECDLLEFVYFQRNPTPGTGVPLLTAPPPLVNPAECKGVQLRWICSRTILQERANTESVQSAKVVIRQK